jgi:hypothetical protein
MQFVREECANHQPNGSCLGVQIAKDLTMTCAKPLPRCLVATGQRCGYFEACVLPLADIVTEPRRAKELRLAATEYRRVTEQTLENIRPCPDCGEPLQPRKKLCPVCAQKRQQDYHREAMRKKRMPVTNPA